MYNLDILHTSEDTDYPFKGWFFGWASEICNPLYDGCDAIFAARAPKIDGPWEVYSGTQNGIFQWDKTMTPSKWVPVIDGGDNIFDEWHTGDPSVIRVDGTYYMAYSASGHNIDGVPACHDDDTDSDLSSVMGAYSSDGINWTRTKEPILIYEDNIGQKPISSEDPDCHFHPEGMYLRPSLMYEDGVYRLWFDGIHDLTISMLYAENHGDFYNINDWNIKRGLDNPLIVNYPNPNVIRIDDIYFAYADPVGYGEGWPGRKIVEAISVNGEDWALLGYIRHDSDVQANHVPEAFVKEEGGKKWIYLTYGAQQPTEICDFCYKSIRMMRRPITDADLERYKDIAKEADGTVPFDPKPDPRPDPDPDPDEEKDFTCGDSFVDNRDGERYKTVKIGNQCWFGEDLRYDSGCTNNEWTTGAPYNACAAQGGGYDGVLYQWGAVMDGSRQEGAQGVCPEGWKVPSDSEWHILERELATGSCLPDREYWGCDPAGTRMKTADWGGNNYSNFTALPGGYRTTFDELQFANSGALWWTSSLSGGLPWFRFIHRDGVGIHRYAHPQADGMSVRCIKDN